MLGREFSGEAVPDPGAVAPRVGVRDSTRRGERRPDRPSVRDAKDRLALVLAGEVEQGPDDAASHLLVRLPAVPALAEIEPPPVLLRKPFFDLVAREPLPPPDVDLAQPVDRSRLQAVRSGNDLGGLEGSTERARVDRVKGAAGKRGRELARLRPAGVVQRWVGVSLEAAAQVPVRLGNTAAFVQTNKSFVIGG